VDSEEQSFIPDTYIPNIAERLQMYHRISACQTEEDLRNLARELVDRFGLIPAPVLSLFDAIRLREIAKSCGLEKIVLKGNKLKAWFISNQQSVFYQSQTFSRLITYIAQQQEFRMVKVDDQIMLACEGVKTLKQAYFKLTQIVNFIQQTEQTETVK
jgi:transcription-repair coupling factor (superfamily II helicase)